MGTILIMQDLQFLSFLKGWCLIYGLPNLICWFSSTRLPSPHCPFCVKDVIRATWEEGDTHGSGSLGRLAQSLVQCKSISFFLGIFGFMQQHKQPLTLDENQISTSDCLHQKTFHLTRSTSTWKCALDSSLRTRTKVFSDAVCSGRGRFINEGLIIKTLSCLPRTLSTYPKWVCCCYTTFINDTIIVITV